MHARRPYGQIDVNTKQQIDALYKDVERKENRNVSLLKELQSLRSEFANQGRDLKMMKNMFEKTNGEKTHLSTDLKKTKAYVNKLETVLERLENPQKMIDENSALQMALESTEIELEQCYASLREREDRIDALNQVLTRLCVLFMYIYVD